MSIIHIYGAAGSGTSTLGKAMQSQYNYTHIDTDDYFWLPVDPPFTEKRPRKERLNLIKQDICKSPRTVISGALCGWGNELIPLFDLVVRLTVPTQIRIARLEDREYKRFGERICEGGDMYLEHLKFLQWASEYDTGDSSMRSKAEHDEWQKSIPCMHLTIDGTLSTQAILEQISKAFKL